MSYDHDLSVLSRKAAGLAARFDGMFGVETVERLLHESYDLLAATSKVNQYLPLLAERFAADRLRSLAKTQGVPVTTTPEILVVCTHNAGRSVAARILLDHHGRGRVTVRSAGSAPGDDINPAVAEILTERGHDVSKEFPKPLTDEAARAADVIITMGCGDACPIFPGKRYLDWDLTDPAGKPVEEVRPIVDDIDRRAQALLAELLDAPGVSSAEAP
ncbi:arsenate reductase ArsC [Acidimicrobiia bacterium EGI L10123]|uniref:arsenate-mycothiol transferase ArsC n=1 Tax=Salinilacustrithrix flava TaxID=2957203 RepID=UPI003D7C3131|nr:arsenate reductase ArsC [Acidimicrobiia bacterium EGI L10123]